MLLLANTRKANTKGDHAVLKDFKPEKGGCQPEGRACPEFIEGKGERRGHCPHASST